MDCLVLYSSCLFMLVFVHVLPYIPLGDMGWSVTRRGGSGEGTLIYRFINT